MDIQYGFCQCGCGGKTRISENTNISKGWVRGEPRKFIHNHHCRGAMNSGWMGGKRKAHEGKYTEVLVNGRYEYEHRVIAEKVLGKALPQGAEVHHYDGHGDESKDKIVICESKSYHRLIEARCKALKACGHAKWRKCKYCHEYDDPSNLYICPQGDYAFHRKCNAIAQSKIREKRRRGR